MYQVDTKWWADNWPIIALVVYFVRNFINNLFANCPFLKANKASELVQGTFNALVQTINTPKEAQPPGEPAEGEEQ